MSNMLPTVFAEFKIVVGQICSAAIPSDLACIVIRRLSSDVINGWKRVATRQRVLQPEFINDLFGHQ